MPPTGAPSTAETAAGLPCALICVELGGNDNKALIALLLRRQRERSGLSLAEVAQRLGQKSRNGYARYEQGRVMPTVDQLEQLLDTVAPRGALVWRFAT